MYNLDEIIEIEMECFAADIASGLYVTEYGEIDTYTLYQRIDEVVAEDVEKYGLSDADAEEMTEALEQQAQALLSEFLAAEYDHAA